MECLWSDADSQEKIIPVDTPFARYPLIQIKGNLTVLLGQDNRHPEKCLGRCLIHTSCKHEQPRVPFRRIKSLMPYTDAQSRRFQGSTAVVLPN